MLRQGFAFVALFAGFLQAAVTRVDVTETTDLAGYERIAGKVYFAVDPKLPANRAIADIDLAPRNAAGLVEFSADLLVLRPKDAAKRNGTAFLEIANRGSQPFLGALNIGAGRSARTEQDLGDRFMLDRGFTLVWVGWQFDANPGPNSVKLYAPVLAGVTGKVRTEILVNQKTTAEALPYAAATVASGALTVRDQADGQRFAIPNDQWKLTGDSRIEYAAGFEPGRLYDFVYTAKDPAMAGLGMAAVRDYIAYIRQRGEVKRAIGAGISQSGRFLRTFLADGFNADEQGKKVFDGVWAHVAGGGHGDFNQRFAQPSRTSGQFSGVDFPTDLPPYLPDELLAKSAKASVAPKLLLSNGSHEYWGRAAGLNHIREDGKRDVAPTGDVRIYFVAGTQHGAGGGANPSVQNPTNPMDWSFFQRAMLVALNQWITDGTAPPASQVPRIHADNDKDQLVTAPALRFPRIPGVNIVKTAYAPRRLDLSSEPPKGGEAFPALVPQVDADGNETSGIRLPELRVPLATYMGWNLRSPSVGAPTEQFPLIGSMVAFPKTRAEREKSGDPRLSIEERYPSQQEYLSKIEAAARDLAKQRFLLEADIPQVVARAKQRWEQLAAR
ncbi:MAG TPA: alpha/beta hydrolase domain-containing protein [Bryobacteraceae bacterium]|nr:alpha/beta hydrolase domain-containing protein [Bryobacteraceae bacterium]